MRRIAARLIPVLCCAGAALGLLAEPGVAGDRSQAFRWCDLEVREWEVQFGPEGRRAWLRSHESVQSCARDRYRVIKEMDPEAVEGVIGQTVRVAQACGAQFQADPETFEEDYSAPGRSPFGVCVEMRYAQQAEIPPLTAEDLDQARRICHHERRAWGRRGHARTWRTERRTLDACSRDQAPLVAATRAALGTQAALERAVHALIQLRRQLLKECVAALRTGSYRVEPPSRTRLGTCLREREAARRPVVTGPAGSDARIGPEVSLAVAGTAVLLAWLLACALLLRGGGAAWFRHWGFHAAFSLPLIGASLIVIGSDVFGDPAGYQLDSRVKNVVLPAAGLAFLLVAGSALRGSSQALRARAPDLLVAALVVLTAIGAVIGLARGNEGDGLVEDLGLTMVFIAGYAAGRLDARRADGAMQPSLIVALVVVAAVVTLLHAPVTPLYGFAPAAAFATVLGVLTRRIRWPWLVLAVATLAVFVHDSVVAGTVPSSVYLQVGVGGLVVAYWLSRRLVPTWAWAAGLAVVAVVALAATDGRSLVTAKYDGSDLSFAQRTYEARAVRSEVRDSPLTLVAGPGLGATVDLSNSPDSATLQAARGDASSVNDVHLLPYDVLRRHGILGVLWLAGLLALFLFLAWRSRGTTDPFLLLLLLVVATGSADALPAASHLFANPFLGFALGTLVTALAVRPPSRRA